MFDIRRIYKTNSNDINNEFGYLSIEVYDSSNNNPVPNAIASLFKVTISGIYYERGEGIQIGRYITDENGKVPLITLPAISNHVGTSPRQRIQYYLTLDSYGYYEIVISEIQIYPNITTSYRLILSPITIQVPKYEFIFNPIIR